MEYAINALDIQQIIVCGHSHCGAMKGLLQLGKLEEEMPLVYSWLKHSEATRRLVKENYSQYSGEELLEITIAENVLTQIDNLKTYPIVHSRLYQRKLEIFAWVYHLETGELLAFDPDTHSYVPPQSQLSIREGGLAPGEYEKTSAPPVACELLQRTPAAENGAKRSLEPILQPVKAEAPIEATPWLTPEQADRIYRGSTARR